MKQILKKINWLSVAQILVVTVVICLPLFAGAQLTQFNCTGTGLNCNDTSINGFIRTVINWLLAIAFGIAVLFLIIGGFWYITSAGNEETAEKGKNAAINAVIGIAIIILSFVIVNVVSKLVGSVGSNNGAGT